MKKRELLTYLKGSFMASCLIAAMSACSDEELISTAATEPAPMPDATTTALATADCSSCTYVVPANVSVIDGKALGLKPGSVIGLKSSVKYGRLLFRNILGSASQPIIIKNCDGPVSVSGSGQAFAIKTENSKYFRITGGDVSKSYGIRISGGNLGITLDKLSTNFEVDHVEVMNIGFAGIMAKTDPTCNDATIRGNFVMTNVSIHDNYVHHTGGEGFYIGNSFFAKGMKTSCGQRLPHEIHYLKLYNNIVKYTGWDAIQIGCATRGAQVYGNTVENYGTINRPSHNNGVQLGEGTGGLFYNNFIKSGPGNGLIVMGTGDNVIHDNVIVNVGGHGVFCDERYTPGTGFKFINNTIVNPRLDGIRLYADLVPMNVVINNIIVNPGSYSSYSYPRTGADAYVYTLSKNVNVQLSNNYFTRSISAVKFVNAAAFNYRLTSGSPARNKGKSISTYNIKRDFYNQSRLKGSYYDIGASEY